MKPLLNQCAWCRAWIDQRGQKITLPKWVVVADHDISHGICQTCMVDKFDLVPQAQRQREARP